MNLNPFYTALPSMGIARTMGCVSVSAALSGAAFYFLLDNFLVMRHKGLVKSEELKTGPIPPRTEPK